MSAVLRARSLVVLPLMLAAVLVVGLVGFAPSADAMTRAQRIGNAVDVVRAQKGDPYSYGSAGPNRFDCSGLVYYSFRRAGFTSVPRTSKQQAQFARRIAKADLRRGDLLFFYNGNGVYHVGVYLGRWDGRRWMMHAPYGGKRVSRAAVWTDKWFAGTLR